MADVDFTPDVRSMHCTAISLHSAADATLDAAIDVTTVFTGPLLSSYCMYRRRLSLEH